MLGLREQHWLAEVQRRVGRPGPELWQILALGLLQAGLNLDCDRLRNLAQHHDQMRQLLGPGLYDETRYQQQRLLDNVALLTPKLLAALNAVLAGAVRLVRGRDGYALSDRHVAGVGCPARSAAAAGQAGEASALAVPCGAPDAPRPARRVVAYLRACRLLVIRAKRSLKALEKAGLSASKLKRIKSLIARAERQIEQSDQCLLPSEKIPQEEQAFSICEPHTGWIAKGQAGCEVEWGFPTLL